MVKIQLSDNKGAVPSHQAAKQGEQIEWQNLTSIQRTLSFSVWPFREAPQTIQISAKSRSTQFTIDPNATSRGYSYSVDPPPGGPPDEPSIVVG